MTESHRISRGIRSLKKTKTLVNDGEETENILYSTQVFGVLAGAPLSAFRSKGIFLGITESPKKLTAEKVYELSQTGRKLSFLVCHKETYQTLDYCDTTSPLAKVDLGCMTIEITMAVQLFEKLKMKTRCGNLHR